IHQHSAHSDGIGAADEPYLRARYAYGDDFGALTDHESFIGKRIGPGEWAYLNAITNRHDEPGVFATLLAYEWTGKKYPGIGRKRDPIRCGLTAVQAKARTREAILEAIRERRCYATSGVPIYLDLRAGEHPMGSEIEVSGLTELTAVARCAAPISALALHGP